MRLLIALVVLAGCESLLGLDTVTARDGGHSDGLAMEGPRSDAAADAAADAATCTMPTSFSDDFMAQSPCAPWGMGSGNVMEAAGALTAHVAGVTVGLSGCVGDNVDFSQGIFVKVTPSMELYTNTDLAIRVFSNYGVTIRKVNNQLQVLNVSGGVLVDPTYDPTTMVWWRLLPKSNGIEASYSADARTWTELTMLFGPNSSGTVTLTVGAACDNCNTSSDAIFQHLNVCPP